MRELNWVISEALSSFDMPEKSLHVRLFRSVSHTTLVHAFIESLIKHSLGTSLLVPWTGRGLERLNVVAAKRTVRLRSASRLRVTYQPRGLGHTTPPLCASTSFSIKHGVTRPRRGIVCINEAFHAKHLGYARHVICAWLFLLF